MQIKSVILENFRGYRDRRTINISDFTAFIGKNDVGKSTVLEALDIFFNEGNGVDSRQKSYCIQLVICDSL